MVLGSNTQQQIKGLHLTFGRGFGMDALDRHLPLQGSEAQRLFSAYSEIFTYLAWGRRPLVSHLINSLLTRALPLEDTGSMLSWALISLALFLLGSSMGKVASWSPLLLALMARGGAGSNCQQIGSRQSWARAWGCAEERGGLRRAAGWKQWLRPAMLKPARAKPEEVAWKINMGLI